jgi:L-alanine-DL-glutamate epimerase-like enolase superfamily enzyme
MKDLAIASVEALPCSVPLKQPVTQGLGSVSKRDTVVVKVTTSDGLVGCGESYNGRAPLAIAATVNTTVATCSPVLTRPRPPPCGMSSSAACSPTTAPAAPACAR